VTPPAPFEHLPDATTPVGRGPGLPVDSAQMAKVLDEFAATFTAEFDITYILRQLAIAATRVLQIDGAGVVEPGAGEQLLRLVFATEGRVDELETLQEQLQTGPCTQAHRTGQVVNVADIASEGSWPLYQRRAGELGLTAVAALPLRARDRKWGVLDLYRTAAIPFSQQELTAATSLANLATSCLVLTEDRETARRAQHALAERAMRDTLVGLPVRWVFLEHLEHALERLRRARTRLAVLFIDIDGLKYVNDTYGHTAGDQLLTVVVSRLRESLRREDILARIGGDEFVVLIDDLANTGDLPDVVGRILRDLGQPYVIGPPETITPSASIGVVHTDDADIGTATLIAHADSAMYQAKRAGPGSYRVFDPESHAAQRAAQVEEEQLVTELEGALDASQFEVHYQPITKLTNMSTAPIRADAPAMYAVEALLRWRHPSRGVLTAATFIDLAETSRLMPRIGRWVLDTACRQLAEWDASPTHPSVERLFLNLSAAELVQRTLVEHTRQVLKETGIAGDRLTLEITETQALHDPNVTAASMSELQKLGCRFAIDDFGTGYSSLSRLSELPAATIKIDRSFSQRVTSAEAAVAVVSAVVTLGDKLSRTVIAEGVEDEETLRALERLGVQHFQGYYLGRPARPDDLPFDYTAER
jgi:diguanylate cyclase (GGDEF)-like protein